MKKLAAKLKGLLKNKEIVDIIIFGSAAKGKAMPHDIDVVLLVEKEKPGLKQSVKSLLPNADVQVVNIKDIYNKIQLSIIKEGFSVKRNEYLSKIYGIQPVKLYKYSLKELTPSKKVMFERGIKFIHGLNKLSNSVVLVPLENSSEFEDFLKEWNLDIETQSYELVPLMRKEEI